MFNDNYMFSQSDFIKIFLAISTMYDIEKIDINSFGFDMVKYFKDDEYKELFLKFEIVQKNDKEYVYTDIALGYAQLIGLLVDSKEGKNIKKVNVPNVDEYILQYPYSVNKVKKLVSSYNKDVLLEEQELSKVKENIR